MTLLTDGFSRGQWPSFNATASGQVDWSLQGPQPFWNEGSYRSLLTVPSLGGGARWLPAPVIISGTIINVCELSGTFLNEDSYSEAQMKCGRKPQAELSELGLPTSDLTKSLPWVVSQWPLGSRLCLGLRGVRNMHLKDHN